MTTRELHAEMEPADMIDVLRNGRTDYDVMGLYHLDQVASIQACCDALELDVRWKVARIGDAWRLEVAR